MINEQNLRSDSEAVSDSAETLPNIDLSILEEMIGKNPEITVKFLKIYHAQLQELAQEIDSAFAVSDYAKISFLAHKLKSSSLSIGAIPLGDICQKLEKACSTTDLQTIKTLQNMLKAEFLAVTQATEYMFATRFSSLV